MSRRVLLLVIVALLAVSAGCLGGGTGEDAGDVDDAADEPTEDAEMDDADGQFADGADGDVETASDVEQLDTQDRQLIRTATIEVEVDSVPDSQSTLTADAEARGGYLSSADRETHERGNETWATETVTYRVPSDEFESFVETVEAEGNVTASSTDTEDVSDELVDLEARIDNLENQRDTLRELFEDAEDTQDVLDVEQRLSEVQGEIERLEAQRESLEDRVAYSTVTVHLVEPEPDPEEKAAIDEPAWYETPVTEAFVASVGGVLTMARASVVFAAYAAPYLLAFGIPVAVAVVGGRRVLRRNSSEELEGSTLGPGGSVGVDGFEDVKPVDDSDGEESEDDVGNEGSEDDVGSEELEDDVGNDESEDDVGSEELEDDVDSEGSGAGSESEEFSVDTSEGDSEEPDT